MRLRPEELQIAFRGLTDVPHFYFYPSIGSTNEKAKELAQIGVQEGTAVIADCQTAGRGRLDRHWFSPPGLGIYLSVVFRPQVPAERAFGVHMAAALATAQAADELDLQSVVGIKWPNDLLAEGRKLAGILSEVGIQGGVVEWCVVGIGLNVNHTRADFPPELRDRAVSLREISHRRLDRLDILVSILRALFPLYARFQDGGVAVLAAEWRRRSTLLGRTVRVETAGETYVGIALGLEEDGALRVRLESGAEEVLHAGDVQLVQYR